MIRQITANELKTRGISAIDESIVDNEGVVITVRGKEKYVVLPMDAYNHLREYELEAAIQESMAEINAGKFRSDSIEKHIKRIKNV